MEIELYSKLQNPIEAIDRIGEMFARSGMFGCDRKEQGQVLAMICLAEHKSPVEITNNYDIIGGKLRRKSLSALGTFRLRGGKHRWLNIGDDGKAAEIELTYDGQTIKSRFTIEEAQAQGLLRKDSNWLKTPGNMLRARAVSNGIAMVAPEIYSGEEPSDEYPQSTPAPGLALGQTATPPAPPPQIAEKAIDVPATIVPMPAAAPEPPPTVSVAPAPVESKPEPKPFAAGPSYSQPANTPELPNELQGQLLEVIGQANVIPAITWMRKEQWLLPDQGLEHLTEARARRIIKQRDSFLAKLGAA